MYKIKDVETRIKKDGLDLCDIRSRLYTEEENTASIRIGINDKQGRIDLKAHGLTPRLHLFM